jgi:hypothetical protein
LSCLAICFPVCLSVCLFLCICVSLSVFMSVSAFDSFIYRSQCWWFSCLNSPIFLLRADHPLAKLSQRHFIPQAPLLHTHIYILTLPRPPSRAANASTGCWAASCPPWWLSASCPLSTCTSSPSVCLLHYGPAGHTSRILISDQQISGLSVNDKRSNEVPRAYACTINLESRWEGDSPSPMMGRKAFKV